MLRSVVSIPFRRSGLEPRDFVFSEELDSTRSAGAALNDGPEGMGSSYTAGGSVSRRAIGGGCGRPGIAAGLERSV